MSLSLRQKKFITELPKNDWNVEKAGNIAGYSPSYAASKLYQMVRQGKLAEGIKKYYDEDKVRKLALQHFKQCKRGKDNTNKSRMIEFMADTLGMRKHNLEVDNKNPDKLVIIHEKQKIEH